MDTLKTMLPTDRAPTAPGEILREEFLRPLGLGVGTSSERAGIDRITASRILNGSRGISPDVSVKLGRLFEVSDGFFLQLQTAVDLWHAIQKADAAGPVRAAVARSTARRTSPETARKRAAGTPRSARVAAHGRRR